ncbi:MAG: hypothetical protein ACLRT5_14570 [Lachnospiraceae bacterium]
MGTCWPAWKLRKNLALAYRRGLKRDCALEYHKGRTGTVSAMALKYTGTGTGRPDDLTKVGLLSEDQRFRR